MYLKQPVEQQESARKMTPKKQNHMFSNSLDYKKSGVDIEAGNNFVEKIIPLAKSTNRKGNLSNLGGFGALFDLRAAGYNDPILVAATDGVGTKLKIAIETKNLESVGVDLVAMCVNDIICQGAEPLFFLDYLATGKLNIKDSIDIVAGIAKGCLEANTALIGGETAEMPGMYKEGEFDLAGFSVGAVERGNELPKGIKVGDKLIGISSSGIHSNGYSLVRMIVNNRNLNWDSPCQFSEKNLGDAFLEPTKIYVKSILELKKKGFLNGLAHITGGGLTENIPRILSNNQGAKINLSSWKIPKVFKWLLNGSQLSEREYLKTFNCGIGMVAVVSEENSSHALDNLIENGELAFEIGEIIIGSQIQYTGSLNLNP
jgi:phosphoribosylformylglycinamidine cyclo-ligase